MTPTEFPHEGDTLFSHPTGPLLRYHEGVLHVGDLNPHVYTRWRMDPHELAGLAYRAMWAAFKASWRNLFRGR